MSTKKLAAVSQLRSTAGLQIKRHSSPKQVSSPQPKTHDVVILYAGRNQIRKITSIAIKDTQTPSGTGEITYPNNTEEETYLQVRYHCTPNSVLLDRRGQHTAQEKTSRSRNFQEQEPKTQATGGIIFQRKEHAYRIATTCLRQQHGNTPHHPANIQDKKTQLPAAQGKHKTRREAYPRRPQPTSQEPQNPPSSHWRHTVKPCQRTAHPPAQNQQTHYRRKW